MIFSKMESFGNECRFSKVEMEMEMIYLQSYMDYLKNGQKTVFVFLVYFDARKLKQIIQSQMMKYILYKQTLSLD